MSADDLTSFDSPWFAVAVCGQGGPHVLADFFKHRVPEIDSTAPATLPKSAPVSTFYRDAKVCSFWKIPAIWLFFFLLGYPFGGFWSGFVPASILGFISLFVWSQAKRRFRKRDTEAMDIEHRLAVSAGKVRILLAGEIETTNVQRVLGVVAGLGHIQYHYGAERDMRLARDEAVASLIEETVKLGGNAISDLTISAPVPYKIMLTGKAARLGGVRSFV